MLIIDRGLMHEVSNIKIVLDPADALHEGGTPVDGSVHFESSGADNRVTWDDSQIEDARISMLRAPEPIAS